MPTTDGPREGHRESPRTFVTQIRDNVPMPPGIFERLLRLEQGRHPTLRELRVALGLDLDFSGAWDVLRGVSPDFAREPPDEELARALDAMYRTISSTRAVTVTLSGDGPQASRAPQPIAVREGEALSLLIFGDNQSGAALELSAEARGTGVGFEVEAGRTASALLDVGTLPAGSYLLPLMLVSNGRPATFDLPIECAPSGTLCVSTSDKESGTPVAARVYLRDDLGPVYPRGATVRKDRHGNAYFHADGGFEVLVSGRARLRVARGIEYAPADVTVDVPRDATTETRVELARWSDMASEGWRSGDVHVHLHYGGEYLLEPADAALVQRAEDVHFMNMMVANQGSGWVHDGERFEGKDHELSDADHILRWGEEYRNDFYGHLCMFGIAALVPPIYSGFAHSEHPFNWPANAEAARHCHTVGGTVSYAHPLFDSLELDRVFQRASTVEAKELPVDAALGEIDAVDVMSYPGHELETAALWYRLLNCGLRLSATAGTDTFMNFADQGAFSNPPAGDRVFVRVDGAFTTDAWCEGVRRGRTFVTNGPMLRLSVDGHAAGDELSVEPGQVVRVEADATSYAPMERVELIVNGDIVASVEATDEGRRARLEHELVVAGSCWVALRARGPSHPLVLDDLLFAHTSPVYLTAGGAPAGRSEDAAYFVEWIDRLIATAVRTNRYAGDEDREQVVSLFRRGQEYYRRIAGS